MTNAAPFQLPPPPDDRQTADGWQRWRETRHELHQLPRYSRAEYDALPADRQILYDLSREIVNSNLPLQETPMSQQVTRVMRARLNKGAMKRGPSTRRGLIINGGGCQGKTETACEVAAACEDYWRQLSPGGNPDALPGTRDLHIPVLYVQTPVTAKPKSICKTILDFYGADHKTLDLPGLIRAVRRHVFAHGTRAILLDDITRLRLHRVDDQDVFDLIKGFMDMGATLVLIGVDVLGSGLLQGAVLDPRTGDYIIPTIRGRAASQGAETQHQRRFTLVQMGPFPYDTDEEKAAFRAHLKGIEEHVRLLDATEDMLTSGPMADYLYERTAGVVGLLECLIEDGIEAAIEAGADGGREELTIDLLDQVPIDVSGAARPPRGRRRDPHPATAQAAQTEGSQHRLRRPRAPARPQDRIMTGAAESPPLPCSLDPLPDESLPGFLLRLSHRLELPPILLLQRTGLAPDSGTRGWGPRGMMMRLSTAEAERFARATRLTVTEVDDLCLERLAPRYPWATPLATTDRSGPRLVTNPWVFTTATRYCPACLAGDGSVIQNMHAGPWLQSWRLPLVFACLRHEQILEHLCPACEQPGLSAPPGAVPRLVPRISAAGLHPAQCRSSDTPALRGYGRNPEICGNRLDEPAEFPTRPAPGLAELLALQRRLDTLLDPAGPATTTSAGAQTTIPRYLNDLRMTCALITATWPSSHSLFPAPDLANAFGGHLSTDASGPHRFSEYDIPPLEPRACASLIAAAVAILDAPDLRALGPLLAADSGGPKSPRNRWIRRFQRTGDQCSEGLQTALEPLTRSFERGGHGRHGRRAPARRIDFGPEHIPEQLEDAWFRQHFRHLERPRPRLLRRAAALSLVQMAAGGSLREAAAFLGIDERYIAPAAGTNVAAAAYRADGADPVEFRLAVRALAPQLNTTTGLIDYKHRRDALHNWYIDEPTWQQIIDRLPRTRGPFRPEISDCKRQFASEVVWARITQGEHILAPRVIEQRHADTDPTWSKRRANMWHFYLAERPKPHYVELRHILHEIADRLAAEIDQRRSG